MPSQQQRDEGDSGAARKGPTPLVCEMFQGINTATTRSGVPDQQLYWCDGFIPLAPRNLRVIPGATGSAYSTTEGNIVCFYCYNIAGTSYIAVFQADGSVQQVETDNGFVTEILPVGTIVDPDITQMGIAQYGSQYLIIVDNQENGYWAWDGSLLYGAGTLAPGIELTDVGSGYTDAPAVVFSGGTGSGAAAAATVENGIVTNVVLTDPGSGYSVGDDVTVTLVGGQSTGTGGALTANLTHEAGGSGAVLTPNFTLLGTVGTINQYRLTSITVTNGGSGYSDLVTANFANPATRGSPDNTWGGPGIPPVISLTVAGGAITGAVVPTASTIVWQTLASSPEFPTITESDPGFYTVTSVTIVTPGSGYSPSTLITVSGGGDPASQATILPVLTGGVITDTTILDGGVYGSNTPPTLTVTDAAVAATATVSLMPFGVSGTCAETYAGHVWVANGPLVQFTAPGSVSDFSTANGGGSFTSSDSFLRVGFTRLINTNGFLFLIGDSSMNYISGVQTNTPDGGSPTTTFTNNNSDPEVGTPYPASAITLGQDIMVANGNGIYVSEGGEFKKVSEPLDGFYDSVSNFDGMQLSAAKQLIHGKVIWFVLAPVIDPVTKTQRNKLLMYNQKYWWTSEQNVDMTFIGFQEINSVFQAFATDGTSIFFILNDPSAAFTKRFQSRLWDAPAGYDHTKSSVNLFSMAQFLGIDTLTYSVYIDNENGTANRAGPYVHNGVTADAEITSVMPPTAIGQVGVLTGFTVETNADDLVIVSVMMQDEVVQYRA